MLLLDETLDQLGSLTRMELQDVILRIVDKEKITTLIITDEHDETVCMSDDICMMSNGPQEKVSEIMEVDFERPRARQEIVETELFHEYRSRLLMFLEDCEVENQACKKHAST
jgi:nitrate/nitrite transport system ATP-binding protein